VPTRISSSKQAKEPLTCGKRPRGEAALELSAKFNAKKKSRGEK